MCLVIVDYMLDDCFQLISLAYLTVGKNHEPPAVYVLDSIPFMIGALIRCFQVFIRLHDQGKQDHKQDQSNFLNIILICNSAFWTT